MFKKYRLFILFSLGISTLTFTYSIAVYLNPPALLINGSLFFGLLMFIEALIHMFAKFSKRVERKFKTRIAQARIWLSTLIILEIIIRISGIQLTYPEITDGIYISSAKQEYIQSWYWVHPANQSIKNQKKEFLFERTTNSIGLSECEIDPKRKSGLRILALGDSFTEGVGTHEDSTFLRLTTNNFQQNGIEVDGVNAGIGGSDPVYEFKLLKDKLLIFEPDILLLTINSTDVSDIMVRGGFDRFNADGTTGVPPPSWDWLYKYNHLTRFITHTILGYPKPFTLKEPLTNEKTLETFKNSLSKFNQLCAEENIKLLVIIQPSLQEFSGNQYDQFEGYDQILTHLVRENISYLELYEVFIELCTNSKKKPQDFYWPIDTHFTPEGYKVFAKGVISKLEELKWMTSQ